MKISRFAGIAATACLAFVTPSVHGQSAPAAEQGARATKPLVIVNRQIDGKSMKFSSAGNWHRIELELKVLPEGIKAALAAEGIKDARYNNATVKWVNNVKATLVVGYKPSGADLSKPKVFQDVVRLKDSVQGGRDLAQTKDASKIENWRFFKASTTALTLEANQPKSIFFYIPAEIVKRDDITNPRPDIAYVVLEVDGKEVPIFDERGALFTGSFGALFQNSSLGKADKATLDKVKEIADRATRDTDGVMRPQNLITSFQDSDWSKSSPEFVREEAAK